MGEHLTSEPHDPRGYVFVPADPCSILRTRATREIGLDGDSDLMVMQHGGDDGVWR